MSWTYSGDPSNSARDAVRFLTGLTSSGNQRVSDEEISWVLGQEGSNNYEAAALVCESLAAKYAEDVNQAVGDLRIDLSNKAKQFEEKAKSLRTKARRRGIAPFVGGVTISGRDAREDETDRLHPSFRVGAMDHPGTTIHQGTT